MAINNDDKEKRIKRREKVLEMMQLLGPFSVTVGPLAKEFECTTKTIYNDITFLIKQIKIGKIDEVGKKIVASLLINLKEAESLRISTNIKEKIAGIELVNKTVEIWTNMLEKYGFKEKMADKLDVNAQGTVINLVTKSIQEIKDAKLKGNTNRDKSEAGRDTTSS